MAEIKIDIEELITKDIAGKVLENVSMEQRHQILETALTKTLEKVLGHWQVHTAIQVDVQRYMVEYLKKPDVQERIKAATIAGVDELMDGVARAVVLGAQERLQNTYKQLVKEEKQNK